MSFTIVTLKQRPDLETQVHDFNPTVWPEFMLEDDVAGRYWNSIFTIFPEFQIALIDRNDKVVATGNSIPIAWDGTLNTLPAGWDAVLEQGIRDQELKRVPTALVALSTAVAPIQQGQGLSSMVIGAMKSIAADHGFDDLIAPVRPTLKSLYPLTPMESYVQWKRPDGFLFDPWLRTHWKLGAKIIRIAQKSMLITGTVAQWEEWAKMRFPKTGNYIVPGALQPVEINCERDQGRYEEPNVWMQHRIIGKERLDVPEA